MVLKYQLGKSLATHNDTKTPYVRDRKVFKGLWLKQKKHTHTKLHEQTHKVKVDTQEAHLPIPF